MSSGAASPITGKYTGNGSATRQYIPAGFTPKRVEIRSVIGEVVLTEQMPGAWKQLDSAVPSFRPAGEVQFETRDALNNHFLGFSVASADTSINGNGTAYYWTAWG